MRRRVRGYSGRYASYALQETQTSARRLPRRSSAVLKSVHSQRADSRMHRVRPGRVIGCKQRMMSGFRMAFPGDAAPQLSARVGRVVASTGGEVRSIAHTTDAARWAGGGPVPRSAMRTRE